MIGLHAGDDAEPAETRDLGRREMLGVLDAETAVVARRSGRRGRRGGRRAILMLDALVDVEERAVRLIADRVNHDLEAGGIGRFGPRVNRIRMRNPEADVVGRVVEGRDHSRGV